MAENQAIRLLPFPPDLDYASVGKRNTSKSGAANEKSWLRFFMKKPVILHSVDWAREERMPCV